MADGDTWNLLLDREYEYHEAQPVVQEEGDGWVRYQDGRKYHLDNRLNRLDTRRWLKFQKSWFIHKPRPRKSEVKLHPAKYPEELIAEFIEFFTKPGMTVLDPMLGTGSSLLAALETGRSGIGIELQPKYAAIARQRLDVQLEPSPPPSSGSESHQLRFRLLQGDAFQMTEMEISDVDYCITSPPYWDMLRAKGSETQKKRKEAGLDVHYSEDENDLGNL
ncbi:MAG: DNA methyltransferase, partial [Candidatus Thermoplasmatota archaeon]|nr:DNA methyltransferase [Candidatus Thermoplasmatota archaeon]